MKRISFILISLFLLCNCEVKVKETKAKSYDPYISYYFKIEERYGMRFGIWYSTEYNTSRAIAIVNLTKEKLEVELLKKQLSEK
jgi:hypothetical protein